MSQLLARHLANCRHLPAPLVEALASRGTPTRARAGSLILEAGAESTAVHVVLAGRIRVTVYSAHGSEVILRDLAAGDLFGELAAIDGAPRSASIVALTDCLVATLPAAAFRSATLATPDAALWLAQRLVGQVRALTDRVFEGSTLRVPARLHCDLLRLCRSSAEGTAEIDPAPTHAEFAARIGTHREAVTRELRYLAGRGIVAQHRRRLVILDPRALATLARTARGDAEDRFAPGPAERDAM